MSEPPSQPATAPDGRPLGPDGKPLPGPQHKEALEVVGKANLAVAIRLINL